MTNFLSRTRLILLDIVAVVLISGCISTEPRITAPHINLSPETMFSEQQTNAKTTLDFGLTVGANESDSLENLEALPGVRVRSVTTNGAAAAAKLKVGDIVLSLDGIDTNHPDTFAAQIDNAQANKPIVFTARRGTTVFDTELQGSTRVQANITERYRVDPIMSRAGYRTDTLTANGQRYTAARIVEIFPHSPFPTANIDIGEAIIAVNQHSVESGQGLVDVLMGMNYGDKVELTVINQQGELRQQTLKLWNPGRRISRYSLWPLFSFEKDLSSSSTKFSVLDLWALSLFKYNRRGNEKNYELFTIFEFGTSIGELVEETETGF